ncbi:hypothetical protein ACLB2K_034300 [Fragaria x ananassa]
MAMELQEAFIVTAICIGFISVCKAFINFVRWVWIMFLRPSKNLKDYGSWAIVTGSAQGIGKVLAFELASKGLNLFLIDRNHSALEATCNEILIESGGKVEFRSMVIDLAKSNIGFTSDGPLAKSGELDRQSSHAKRTLHGIKKWTEFRIRLSEARCLREGDFARKQEENSRERRRDADSACNVSIGYEQYLSLIVV